MGHNGQGTARNKRGQSQTLSSPSPHGPGLKQALQCRHRILSTQQWSSFLGEALRLPPRQWPRDATCRHARPGPWSVPCEQRYHSAALLSPSRPTTWHNPAGATVPGKALIRVAQAAPCAHCLRAGLGARAQEPVGDRVLHDDVLHSGDIQKRQQHSQELQNQDSTGEHLCISRQPSLQFPGPRNTGSQPEPS